jgi:hypothetical protein
MQQPMPGRNTILLNPMLSVMITFIGGFLVWYFLMPETSLVPGIAPRHETANATFIAFITFSAFAVGMLLANPPKSFHSAVPVLDDRAWIRLAWTIALVALIADYLYIRSGLGQLRGSDTQSYVDKIHNFANTVRDQSSFGVTSLNNLFPVPLYVGAALAMTARKVGARIRLQGAAVATLMTGMAFFHGAVGFGRIWFLFSLFCLFIAWIIERRPRLLTQIFTVLGTAAVAITFIFVMELLRNVGLTAQATNMSLTDPRILRLAFLTLTQAYVASDINNAMVVFDCHPALQMISTFDVLGKLWTSLTGHEFQTYADCVGWTTLFGTIDFLAMLWWDWGYVGVVAALAIGFAIQTAYYRALKPSSGVTLSQVLYPNVLFGAMHLTRTMFIGSTEFILPALLLLILWMAAKLGTFPHQMQPASRR